MFKHTLQPPVISLFSSSSSHPLLLSSAASTSRSFPEDSWISLVDDSTDTFLRSPSSSPTTIGIPSPSTMKGGSTSPTAIPTPTASSSSSSSKGSISGPALHLQSPDIKSTFIRFGDAPSASVHERGVSQSSSSSSALGIEAGYVHLFLKPLGHGMGFYVDVLVMDERGNSYVIRASTFQTQPHYTPQIPTQSNTSHSSLLHLPLAFPPPSTHALTPWVLLSLPLPDLLLSLPDLGGPSPPPRYKSLQSIEVHANCRLKRIWCTEERGGGVVHEAMALRGMMTELCLFEAETMQE
ncbi:BQ2448_6839 [Microbotryum intermedium]|uniref:BQ2448_6839 protein n=1 Tax=Microbotryum intermedium TaxID=269621 RepID=A0A238FMA4_9BASI|nr:BQ2448_6839 [Microbotryum intermedium]